ncbi:DUF6252 family protein [Tenacibaculum tangerinum]|uniref:DUF6252 family protein n=1 Tax=Tenacibaculum tangerinum TaxID=3038772 RepID=A0ABY8L1Z9_9FLAO|nr:DUF6252 family protein [Tenacibaculum tangerinum]WGH74388.1 DUF6252 family protein [Tenacibaculum tangerinum]
MKIKILKTVLLFAVILFFNCSNNDDSIEQDQLPPITQTGANTFGCVVNGKVLIPKDALPSLGGPQSSARRGLSVNYHSNNNFVIYAGNFRGENKPNIYIYINNLTSTGTYSFGLSNGESISTFEPTYPHCWIKPFSIAVNGQKYLSNTNSGIVTITKFDSVNNIISGTFQLTAFDENNPRETIEVTNGRFDFNLNTVNN